MDLRDTIPVIFAKGITKVKEVYLGGSYLSRTQIEIIIQTILDENPLQLQYIHGHHGFALDCQKIRNSARRPIDLDALWLRLRPQSVTRYRASQTYYDSRAMREVSYETMLDRSLSASRVIL